MEAFCAGVLIFCTLDDGPKAKVGTWGKNWEIFSEPSETSEAGDAYQRRASWVPVRCAEWAGG